MSNRHKLEQKVLGILHNKLPIINKFSVLALNKEIPGFVYYGLPGTGKTFPILQILERESKRSGEKYKKITGAVSSSYLFSELYRNRDSLLIFDDCDSVFDSVDSLNLLKAATDSTESPVCWSKQRRDGLPSSFFFYGSIIIVTNFDHKKDSSKKKRPHIDALVSRLYKFNNGISSEMLPALASLFVRAGSIYFPDSEREDIIEWIWANWQSIPGFSLRTLLHIKEIKANFPDWQNVAKYSLMSV